MNWFMVALGLGVIVMSFRATHVTEGLAGSKPLYPVPKRVRVMFFIGGSIILAYGIAGLVRS
jgi:hypothetical protein